MQIRVKIVTRDPRKAKTYLAHGFQLVSLAYFVTGSGSALYTLIK